MDGSKAAGGEGECSVSPETFLDCLPFFFFLLLGFLSLKTEKMYKLFSPKYLLKD